MQKSQIMRHLPAAVNEKIVMRFIVDCKLMAGTYCMSWTMRSLAQGPP